MSARSIHKNLMRNCRVNSFWGRRAHVPLRIPREFFPEPFPSFEGTLVEKAESAGLVGFWTLPHEDGTVSLINASRITCGADPRKRENEDDEIYYALKDESFVSEYTGKLHEDFSWWEAHETRGPATEDGFPNRDDERTTLREIGDEDDADLRQVVDRMIARDEWEKKYLRDYDDDGWDPRFLGLFHEAEFWSKTWYFDEHAHPDYYYLIFSVKWFYPNRRKRFCAAANRLLKYLKKQYPKTKII